MSFSSLIGQDTAIAALKAAINRDAVPQAYLFVGSEGVGKTTAAIEFSKALCCKRPSPDGDPCDSCVNCNRINANEHPDFTRIAPEGDFTRIWQLWSRSGHPTGALESLSYAPVAAPRRIYLLERAETLNDESANSLLKALEEPPRYVNFILCAPSPSAVLPTILSRCQMVRFRQVPAEAIARTVAERKGVSLAEARMLAAYSEGGPGRAIRLADATELRDQRASLLDLAEKIARSPGIAAFRLAEELRNGAKPAKPKKGEDADAGEEKSGRGDLARSLDVLSAWYSDLLAISLRGGDAPLIHEDRRTAIQSAAARYRLEQLTENAETLAKFRRYLTRNANAQLATEALMLKLTPKKA